MDERNIMTWVGFLCYIIAGILILCVLLYAVWEFFLKPLLKPPFLILVEAWSVWLNRSERYLRIRAWWRWFLVDLGRACREVFGRFRIKKKSYKFNWFTYYMAVNQSLRHARMAKRSWGQNDISAATCCEFYYRYEDIQKRAREKGYVHLASGDIHDRYVSRALVKVKGDMLWP